MNAGSLDVAVRTGGRDAVTWYCYLLLGYLTYLLSIQGNILPFLREELGLSYRAASLHTSAIAVGILVVGLLGDRAVTRLGRRAMLMVSGLGAALATILLTLSPAAPASIASCFLIGLFGGFIPVMVPAILSDIFGSRRDIAFAESNAMSYAFAIMAPLLSGLAAWLGWSWRMPMLAGAAAGIVIVALYWRQPVPPTRATREATARPLPLAFWCYFVVLGRAVAVEFSILLWAPSYLETVVGLTPTAAATGTAAFFVAMLAGRVAGAPLFGLFPTRRLYLAAAAVTLVGFALYRGSPDATLAIAGLFVVGLGVALLFPLALSFGIGVAGEAADRGGARLMLAPGLAILLNPPIHRPADDPGAHGRRRRRLPRRRGRAPPDGPGRAALGGRPTSRHHRRRHRRRPSRRRRC